MGLVAARKIGSDLLKSRIRATDTLRVRDTTHNRCRTGQKRPQTTRPGAVAKWPKAADCKSVIPGSNPGGASLAADFPDGMVRGFFMRHPFRCHRERVTRETRLRQWPR